MKVWESEGVAKEAVKSKKQKNKTKLKLATLGAILRLGLWSHIGQQLSC